MRLRLVLWTCAFSGVILFGCMHSTRGGSLPDGSCVAVERNGEWEPCRRSYLQCKSSGRDEEGCYEDAHRCIDTICAARLADAGVDDATMSSP